MGDTSRTLSPPTSQNIFKRSEFSRPRVCVAPTALGGVRVLHPALPCWANLCRASGADSRPSADRCRCGRSRNADGARGEKSAQTGLSVPEKAHCFKHRRCGIRQLTCAVEIAEALVPVASPSSTKLSRPQVVRLPVADQLFDCFAVVELFVQHLARQLG